MYSNNIIKPIFKKIPTPIKKILKYFLNKIKNLINLIKLPIDILKEKNRKKIWVSNTEVLEYKKDTKVYDVFYFFNELDLLEIRLNILNDYVDYFVIIESTESFSGLPHTLCYKKNLERFSKWKDKIIYYVVNDFPNDKELLSLAENNSNVGSGEHYWIREFYQKESTKKALINLKDIDIVFVSDCDEIWNPLQLKNLTDFSKSEIVRPKQLAYYYYLNNRCSEINGWTGTIVAQYKTIKNKCLNDIRTRKKTRFIEIENGGWHFGFMGGVKGAMKKLTEWQHPEYLGWISKIEDRVNKNQDYRGRKYKFWKDEKDLPIYILENKEKYKELFK
jgi:beta-1,4-mannosyl-glycoprotein beta-1,4-N-acetylglucosaminyltransferase